MIDLQNESLIRFSEIPAWCAEYLGRPINRSTAHRWRTRGVRGEKLETVLCGGVRFTSVEGLERFFAASTAAADGDRTLITGGMSPTAIAKADEFLASEGL